MEDSELHPKLLLYLLLLLTDHCQSFNHTAEHVAAYPHIDPNRLQFFVYESIRFSCEGLPGLNDWRVMKATSSRTTQWESSTRSLNIYPALVSHSGEYWCENEDGEKSSVVNINITAGDVILEIPALPVMEQQNVTLRCKKRQSPKNSVADFYKDGHFRETGYKGTMTIHNVSSSDEGLYMCRSEAGESPESRLAVTAYKAPTPQNSSEDVQQSTLPPLPQPGSQLVIILSVSIAVLFVAVLLTVTGLLYHQKHRGSSLPGKIPGAEAVYENACSDPNMMTYMNVRREKNKNMSHR